MLRVFIRRPERAKLKVSYSKMKKLKKKTIFKLKDFVLKHFQHGNVIQEVIM